jgi:hypothetical protein
VTLTTANVVAVSAWAVLLVASYVDPRQLRVMRWGVGAATVALAMAVVNAANLEWLLTVVWVLGALLAGRVADVALGRWLKDQ